MNMQIDYIVVNYVLSLEIYLVYTIGYACILGNGIKKYIYYHLIISSSIYDWKLLITDKLGNV